MAKPNEPDRRGDTDWEQFGDQIGRKEKRKIKGRADRRKSPLFWVGMFGLVGWSVSVPILIGLYLGIKMDQWYPAKMSWTLTGLLSGVTLGCLNAWYWVKRESNRED